VRKTTQLARSGAGPTNTLAEFLASTKETKGFDALTELIYNFTAAQNGFDKYGHFSRLLVTLTNCLEYEVEESGCSAKFTGPGHAQAGASEADLRALLSRMEEEGAGEVGGTLAQPGAPSATLAPAKPTTPETPEIAQGRKLGARSAGPAPRQRALLDYLLGP